MKFCDVHRYSPLLMCHDMFLASYLDDV